MHKRNQLKNNTSPAFTIVELLIVIVVIGILAAITIVSYMGIQRRAAETMLKSDLSSAAKQLETAKVDNNDIYQASVTNLKKSTGTNFQYTYTPGSNYYCLSAVSDTSGISAYYIDSTSKVITEGVCTGHTLPGDPVTGWKYVAAGQNITCGLTLNNKVYCWGRNLGGKFGTGTTTDSITPVATNMSGVLAGKTLTGLAIGQTLDSVCAYNTTEIFCWGSGVLGNGVASSTNSVPVAVTMSGVLAGKTIKSVMNGGGVMCAIASDDKEYCWGYSGVRAVNSSGTPSSSTVPMAWDQSSIFGSNPVQSVAHFNATKCAVVAGLGYCWGASFYGERGDGITSGTLTAPQAVITSGVLSGKVMQKVSRGDSNTCSIASGQAYCWGFGRNNDLGDGLSADSNVPVAVSTAGVLNGKTLTDIGTGKNFSCALATDNKMYCWGNATYGKLGNGGSSSTVPVAVTMSGISAQQMSVGYYHTCFVATDDQMYCYGQNTYGELGDGSTTNRSVPVKVTLP